MRIELVSDRFSIEPADPVRFLKLWFQRLSPTKFPSEISGGHFPSSKIEGFLVHMHLISWKCQVFPDHECCQELKSYVKRNSGILQALGGLQREPHTNIDHVTRVVQLWKYVKNVETPADALVPISHTCTHVPLHACVIYTTLPELIGMQRETERAREKKKKAALIRVQLGNGTRHLADASSN